ncbi:MAG TPA: hypothetical protein VGF01_00095, partial [Terracidiphilus sp.]
MNNICAERDEKLAELLLDAENAPVEVLDHLEECESCRGVLEELRATMAVLDEWEAPEPNPY